VHSGPVVKGKDAPKKAVLLSGAPGIGKTSAAKIMCAIEGFDVMEVNASDARGKVRAFESWLLALLGRLLHLTCVCRRILM